MEISEQTWWWLSQPGKRKDTRSIRRSLWNIRCQLLEAGDWNAWNRHYKINWLLYSCQCRKHDETIRHHQQQCPKNSWQLHWQARQHGRRTAHLLHSVVPFWWHATSSWRLQRTSTAWRSNMQEPRIDECRKLFGSLLRSVRPIIARIPIPHGLGAQVGSPESCWVARCRLNYWLGRLGQHCWRIPLETKCYRNASQLQWSHGSYCTKDVTVNERRVSYQIRWVSWSISWTRAHWSLWSRRWRQHWRHISRECFQRADCVLQCEDASETEGEGRTHYEVVKELGTTWKSTPDYLR